MLDRSKKPFSLDLDINKSRTDKNTSSIVDKFSVNQAIQLFEAGSNVFAEFARLGIERERTLQVLASCAAAIRQSDNEVKKAIINLDSKKVDASVRMAELYVQEQQSCRSHDQAMAKLTQNFLLAEGIFERNRLQGTQLSKEELYLIVGFYGK